MLALRVPSRSFSGSSPSPGQASPPSLWRLSSAPMHSWTEWASWSTPSGIPIDPTGGRASRAVCSASSPGVITLVWPAITALALALLAGARRDRDSRLAHDRRSDHRDRRRHLRARRGSHAHRLRPVVAPTHRAGHLSRGTSRGPIGAHHTGTRPRVRGAFSKLGWHAEGMLPNSNPPAPETR
jgi:hypothetical protein